MRSPQGHACSGYMKRLAPSLPLFAALLGLVAIGGCSTPGARDSGFPACTWPAIYDTEAAASGAGGACFAGRAYLTCTSSNGGGEGCLSNNLTQCPGPSATGLTYSNCQDACQLDEYVLMCGSIGPPQAGASPTSTPPAACHLSSAINPGGREPYCCLAVRNRRPTRRAPARLTERADD